MSVDLTQPCADCGLPLEAHIREGRIVACRGRRIPDVLTLTQLCMLLALAPRTVYNRRKNHSHPAIVELPRFEGHVRFSGQAVRDWLNGNHQLRLARRRA